MCNNPTNLIRQHRYRIKNRCGIHPCGKKYIINITHIPEKYRCLCQKHSHTKSKQINLNCYIRKQNKINRKWRSRDHHNQHHCSQRKQKIHQITCHLRQREDIFGNIYFFEECSIIRNRIDGMYSCIIYIIINCLTNDQINRIVLHIKTKNTGKHNHHHQHDHQRI